MTGHKKEKIMIVDDSRLQRLVLREMLQESFELIEAASGEECLKLFEEGADVDLVLLDIVMQGMDGFDVLRYRQHMPNFRDTPVIVLTTSDSDLFQTDAFGLGADDYMIKSVDDNVALSRINNVLGARRRIKALLQKQEELRIMSEVDAMTKLFNKRMTEQLVTETLETHSENLHALFVVDIDNFKAVNDIFGHKVGDHTISVVAGVLSSSFSNENYIGRIGGDEFVVLMCDIASKNEALQKADELVQIIRKKENLTIPENISLSIGVVFSEKKNQTYAELFTKADEALYYAKKSGKGCYFEYGSEMKNVDTQEKLPCVLAYTSSRNVSSILEFVLGEHVLYHQVSSLEDMRKAVLTENQIVSVIYVDVSEQEDAGKKIWDALKSESWIKNLIVVAICQEGNMEQVTYVIESGLVKDMMFAPINAERVARRIIALEIL